MNALRNITSEQAIVGALIAKLRDMLDPPMRQQELAKKMGLSSSAWSRVEKGETALSAEQLRELSKVFDVSADHFFELVDKAKAGLTERGVEVGSSTFFKNLLGNHVARTAAAGAMAGMVVPIIGPVLGGLIGGILGHHFFKQAEDLSDPEESQAKASSEVGRK